MSFRSNLGWLLVAASLAAFTASAEETSNDEPEGESEPEASSEEHEHAHEHLHEHLLKDLNDGFEVIYVTANPLEHEGDELANSVDHMTREELATSMRGTLGETVGQLPGVSTSGFTAGASRPVIRGQDAFRTEVLETGLATQDVSRLSPDHAIPLSPVGVQRIEVVRGPGVLRYGGGASGGVVNAITSRVPRERLDAVPRAEVLGSYLHNGDGGEVGGLLEGGIGDLTWHVDGLFRDTGDYRTGTGDTQDGTHARTWSATGAAAYIFDQGRLGGAYTRYESDYGIPEDEPVEIRMRSNRYRLEADWDTPTRFLRRATFRGAYSDYRHEEIAEGVVGQTFDNDEFDGRVEVIHERIGGFFGAFGLHGRYQDLVAGGEAVEFLAPSETTLFAAYLFEEIPLGDLLDLQFGFRAEGDWVEGTPIEGGRRTRRFAPLSGSVALIAHPGPVSIGVTTQVSQRAPSQVELFARGPHEATGTFEVGDPDFDEETSFNGELRLTGNVDRFRFEASGFATWYRDYIFGELTGLSVDEDGVPDPGGELDQLFYRGRDALFVGGELTLGADLFDLCDGTLGTDWQVDYVRARFTEGGGNRNVPRIPPLRWGGSLVYDHPDVTTRFGFLRYEAQWDPGASEFATDAFTLLDWSVLYRLPWLTATLPIALSFEARNLLDEKARNAISFTKEEVLLPGRNYRVGVRVEY